MPEGGGWGRKGGMGGARPPDQLTLLQPEGQIMPPHYLCLLMSVHSETPCKHPGIYINVSSVVEFEKWWVLKSKIFGQKSIYSKETVVF